MGALKYSHTENQLNKELENKVDYQFEFKSVGEMHCCTSEEKKQSEGPFVRFILQQVEAISTKKKQPKPKILITPCLKKLV